MRKLQKITRALNDSPMLDEQSRFERKNGKAGVRILDGTVSAFHHCSDGLQSVVALCTDIMISLL